MVCTTNFIDHASPADGERIDIVADRFAALKPFDEKPQHCSVTASKIEDRRSFGDVEFVADK